MKNKLKYLAEQHYCFNKKLKPEEEKLLKNSKYKSLIHSNTTFDSLFERCISEQIETFTKTKRKGIFNGGNKEAVRALVDDIEETFGIGIENMSLTKFEDVDFKKVQTYIKNYLDKHKEEIGGRTFAELQEIATNSTDIYELLRGLYLCGS